MKKIISIVTTLVMAFTIFVIPTWGVAYAGDELATTDTVVAEDEVNALAAPTAAPQVSVISKTTSSITFGWDTVEGADGYKWSTDPTDDNSWNDWGDKTSYELPGLESGKNYTLYVLAYNSEGIGPYGSASGTTEEVVGPTAPAKPANLTSTSGYTNIVFKWDAVQGDDIGYAYSRYKIEGAIGDEQLRDNGTTTSFNWTSLKEGTKHTLYVFSYVIVDKDTPGAVLINRPIGESGDPYKYVLLSEVVSKEATTKYSEKITKTKQSRGYVYRYYNDRVAKGRDLGTSYAMWNTIKNQSSKTKYLIAVDNKRNNVVVYVGKKGNWKVKYHWICCTGSKEHKSPKGVFKVFKKKPKFSGYIRKGNKVTRDKYTCWYTTRFRGQCFFHSILYKYNSKKATVDTRLGMNISHGCVRLAIGNAKWIYNNIGKGTTVVSYDFAKNYQYR